MNNISRISFVIASVLAWQSRTRIFWTATEYLAVTQNLDTGLRRYDTKTTIRKPGKGSPCHDKGNPFFSISAFSFVIRNSSLVIEIKNSNF